MVQGGRNNPRPPWPRRHKQWASTTLHSELCRKDLVGGWSNRWDTRTRNDFAFDSAEPPRPGRPDSACLRTPRSYAFPDALDHPLATAALRTPPERDASLDATRLRTPPDYASACATGHLATASDRVRSLSTAIAPLGHLDSEGTRQPYNPRPLWPRRHKQRAPATFLLWDFSLFCLTGLTGEGIRQPYSLGPLYLAPKKA